MTESQKKHICGIILAGGMSSRLGRDKASLNLYPCKKNSGKGDAEQAPDLLTHSARLLATFFSRVIIIGREHDSFEWLKDEYPGLGPIGALVTALRHTGGPCLALSCDLPFMNAPTLKKLVEARKYRPADTLLTAYYYKDTGKVEHLVGLYEYASLAWLDSSLSRGLLKISLALPHEHVHKLPYELTEALPFFNINYPADLMLAQKFMVSGRNKKLF